MPLWFHNLWEFMPLWFHNLWEFMPLWFHNLWEFMPLWFHNLCEFVALWFFKFRCIVPHWFRNLGEFVSQWFRNLYEFVPHLLKYASIYMLIFLFVIQLTNNCANKNLNTEWVNNDLIWTNFEGHGLFLFIINCVYTICHYMHLYGDLLA